jgi:hypothetical protein
MHEKQKGSYGALSEDSAEVQKDFVLGPRSASFSDSSMRGAALETQVCLPRPATRLVQNPPTPLLHLTR